MGKKLAINVNKKDEELFLEMARLYGMNKDCYGWIPQTIKKSIKILHLLIAHYSKHRQIPMIPGSEFDELVESVQRYRLYDAKFKIDLERELSKIKEIPNHNQM